VLETLRVEQWLVARLKADATLNTAVGGRVYGYVAPAGTAFPYVLFFLSGGHDVIGVGPARIMVDAVYTVKAVGQAGSPATLAPIVDRIDAVLHGSTGGVAGGDGLVLAAMRETPVTYVEVADGMQYRHVGAMFRIWSQGL